MPATHPNARLINRFYEAFARRDYEVMAACYTPDARFSDPVFPELRGAQVGAMWRMLCERGTDLRIRHRDVVADDTTGSAHWEAWYTFSTTGRKVHNVIDASFVLRDGKIAEHDDRFGLYRWSRQALGLTGTLLGWTPIVSGKIRGQAGSQLEKFMARHGGDA